MDTITNIDTSLSKKLKHYRRVKNFSQEGLAQASGISVRTIQRIEIGDSIGSAYTLDKLATALDIDVSKLTGEPAIDGFDYTNSRKKLNLLNLSVLSVILMPLSNIILPVLILSKNKGNEELNQSGRKILNFQILWTLTTLILIILIPLFLLLFKPFHGTSIPLSIPAYYLCVIVNICLTLKFSVAINNRQEFLDHIPNIL